LHILRTSGEKGSAPAFERSTEGGARRGKGGLEKVALQVRKKPEKRYTPRKRKGVQEL